MLQEKHRPFQPPLSPLLQKMFRKNLYNWKLYKVQFEENSKKPPEVRHGIPNFAHGWEGNASIPWPQNQSLEDERIHYYYIAKGEKVPINYDYSSFSKS